MRKLTLLLLALVLVLPFTATAQDDGCPEDAMGLTVSIISTWTGNEEQTFLEVLAPVVEACDLTIEHEGTRDLTALLATRVQGDNAPDISIMPDVGSLTRYKEELVSLEELGADKEAYSESWINLGTVDEKWVGLFVKADVKDLVWYSPIEFEAWGYEVPATLGEWFDMVSQMVEDGVVPLSMGMESGEATGWTGTDTVQGLMLRQQGVEFTDGLVTGETAWTDPGVVETWQTFVDLATDPDIALGGADGTLNTAFDEAIYAVFQDPPQAMMVRQSGFAGNSITAQFPELVYGEDFAFFAVPAAEEGESPPMQIGADALGVFNDTPATREIIKYLTSEEGALAWAASGFDLSPNMYATGDAYENPISADKADALVNAPAVSFDVGDLLPGGMGQDEFQNLTAVVNGTKTVEEALADMQARFEEVTSGDMMEEAKMPGADAGEVLHYIVNVDPYGDWEYWPSDEMSGDLSGYLEGGSPHGNVVRILVNGVAYEAAMDFQGELPYGSIIVKENYPGESVDEPGDLAALTIMYKLEGFNPEAGDWFWVKASGDASVVDAEGAVGGCIDCHGQEGNIDYVLRYGFGEEPAVKK